MDETGGRRARPHQPRTQPQLVYQRNGVAVRAEEVVVELLQVGIRRAGEWKAGSQAPRCRLPLQHGHRLATLGQPQRDCETQRTGAQHPPAGGVVLALIAAHSRSRWLVAAHLWLSS